jgi:hypothetical protein
MDRVATGPAIFLCFGLRSNCVEVVVEGAAVQHVCTESLTMIFLNIVLLAGIIGVLCWLVFTLAVYALPLCVGATFGIAAHNSGAGGAGSFIIGVVAAGAVAIVGRLVFAFARPLWMRLIVSALFAGPAAVAGYAATHGIAKHLIPSDGWQIAFSLAGAIAVGVTALFRLAGAAPPEPGLQGAAALSRRMLPEGGGLANSLPSGRGSRIGGWAMKDAWLSFSPR